MGKADFEFKVAPGVVGLMQSAINKERASVEYSFHCDGDLSQMAAQKSHLESIGVSTQQDDVYPCIRKEDVEKALRSIWQHRIPGWWHYREKYKAFGICSGEDFDSALDFQIEEDRRIDRRQ
jgi:hypothetical protein